MGSIKFRYVFYKFEEAAQFWVYREYKYPTRNYRLSVFTPLGSKVLRLFRY